MIRLDQSNHSNGFSDDDADSIRKGSLIEFTKSHGQRRPDNTDFRRHPVGKSKSVDQMEGWMRLSSRSGSKRAQFLSKSQTKMEAKTVKSDTACLSTKKHMRRSTMGAFEITPKQSPSSIFEFDAQAPERASSDKKQAISVLPSHDDSVLQQFPGFDESQQLSLDLDMSEDETIDVSSFANDSLPSSFRMSTSTFSIPSDLTSSTGVKDFSMTSFQSPKRKPLHVGMPSTGTLACSTADSTPLPPRRQSSYRSTFGRIDMIQEIPLHIDCLPTDSSPKKPSRQTSIRQLPTSEDSLGSSLISSLSIDTSPKKPTRQNSCASLLVGFNESPPVASTNSTDSSPLKPQRRKSLQCEGAITTPSRSKNGMQGIRAVTPSSSGRSFRRKVVRSESSVQHAALRPVLARRESVATQKELKKERSGFALGDHGSILEETLQEIHGGED